VGYEALNETREVDSSATLRTLISVTALGGGIGIVGLFSGGIPELDIGLAFNNRVSVNGGVIVRCRLPVSLSTLSRVGSRI
jgi:threonine dehydrogenase-like Zn-dependent dehydrogenase